MYNVHVKRYTVAQARQRLAEAIDSAENGEPVIIERRGVRFRLEAVRPRRRSARRVPLLDILDPAVSSGNWTWSLNAGRLRFKRRARRR